MTTSFPDEEYLKKRQEMKHRDRVRGGIIGSINRYLDDDVRKYSKGDLGTFGLHDWEQIKAVLENLESRGLLRMIKTIDEATEQDVVVEMLNYIDQKSNCPNWPLKSA